MVSTVKNTLASVEQKITDLKDRAKKNWSTRKAEVIGSGISTSALAGGVAASAMFGPVGAIIAAAALTLASLVLFLRALFREPKQAEQPKKQEIELVQVKV